MASYEILYLENVGQSACAYFNDNSGSVHTERMQGEKDASLSLSVDRPVTKSVIFSSRFNLLMDVKLRDRGCVFPLHVTLNLAFRIALFFDFIMELNPGSICSKSSDFFFLFLSLLRCLFLSCRIRR